MKDSMQKYYSNKLMAQISKIEEISKIKDESLRKKRLIEWAASSRNMVASVPLTEEGKKLMYDAISQVIDVV